MAVGVISSSLEHDGNMSRVRIEQELEVICVNTSTVASPACDRSAQGIILSTPILMMTFGVVGNVLALIVLYSSRREAHARRTVFFVMLAGLAWTDLIGQFAVSPIAIITYANNLRWVGGVPLCRYHGFMMVSFGLVTPLVVCCMSIERLLAIKFSYYYAKHITRRKAQCTFLACWFVTAIFTSLPFAGVGSYELQYPGTWCFLNFHKQSKVDTIYAAMFSSFNILAIIIMIICNLIVAATLFRMRRSRHLNSSPSIDRRLSTSGMGSAGTFIRGRRHSDMETQMIWFLCLITVAFSVCWLPLNVHILLVQITGSTNQVLDLKVIRMASCNQILDPWLYVIFRKNSLLRIIRRIKSCCSILRHIPQNGPTKAPNMRYIMSNRSYTYEATSLGKTVMDARRCVNSQAVSAHKILEVCDEKKTERIEGSSDSVAQLMSCCSYCDCQCHSFTASNHLAELAAPDLSPYSTDMKRFNYSLSDCPTKSGTDHRCSGRRPSCLENTMNGMSEPLLELVQPKAEPKKIFKNLDFSVSSESNGAYYSLDSTHHPSLISANYSIKKRTKSAQKISFLELLKISPKSRSLPSQKSRSQTLACANNRKTHLLPSSASSDHVCGTRSDHVCGTSSDHVCGTISLFTAEDEDNLAPGSERRNYHLSHVNIPLNLEDVHKCIAIKRNGRATTNGRNHVTTSGEIFTSKYHRVYPDDRTSLPNDVTNKEFSFSDGDMYLTYLQSTQTSENIQNGNSGNHKTRCNSAVLRDLQEEDSHRHVPLTSSSCQFRTKPTSFPGKFCQIKSSIRPSHAHRNSVSVVGSKPGNLNCFLPGIDHSDHIKCFKAKKTRPALGRNATVAYLEGLRNLTNACEHGNLEHSLGSRP